MRVALQMHIHRSRGTWEVFFPLCKKPGCGGRCCYCVFFSDVLKPQHNFHQATVPPAQCEGRAASGCLKSGFLTASVQTDFCMKAACKHCAHTSVSPARGCTAQLSHFAPDAPAGPSHEHLQPMALGQCVSGAEVGLTPFLAPCDPAGRRAEPAGQGRPTPPSRQRCLHQNSTEARHISVLETICDGMLMDQH